MQMLWWGKVEARIAFIAQGAIRATALPKTQKGASHDDPFFQVLVFKVLKIGICLLISVQRYGFFLNYAIAKICYATQFDAIVALNYALCGQRGRFILNDAPIR